jgi:glutaredoxin
VFLKLLFLPVRIISRPLLLMMEYLFRAAPQQRGVLQQQELDKLTQGVILYQFKACPFCIKVRRAIHRLNLNIEQRNANENPQYKTELMHGGGRWQTPCLRIEQDGEAVWLYESNDIIAYLDDNFGDK